MVHINEPCSLTIEVRGAEVQSHPQLHSMLDGSLDYVRLCPQGPKRKEKQPPQKKSLRKTQNFLYIYFGYMLLKSINVFMRLLILKSEHEVVKYIEFVLYSSLNSKVFLDRSKFKLNVVLSSYQCLLWHCLSSMSLTSNSVAFWYR